MGTFDRLAGKAIPGKTLEKLDEISDLAIGASGYRKTATIGGKTEQCFLMRDGQGKIIKSGSDTCLGLLEEDIARMNNPLLGSTNTEVLKESQGY